MSSIKSILIDFPGGSDSKESACRRPRFDPWVKKIPWKREWQPTPVFLPREFNGQRSLEGSVGSQRDRPTEKLTLRKRTHKALPQNW